MDEEIVDKRACLAELHVTNYSLLFSRRSTNFTSHPSDFAVECTVAAVFQVITSVSRPRT